MMYFVFYNPYTLDQIRSLQIVDTPGVCDTYRDPEEVLFEISKCLILTVPGPHAMLFVINIDSRFTEEEEKAYKQLRGLFARHLADHIIVVFTRSEKYYRGGKSDEEAEREAVKMFNACKEKTEEARRQKRRVPDINSVLQDAQQRFVLFCNNGDQDTKDRQVLRLLEKIESLKFRSSNPYFQDEKTKNATTLTKKRIEEIMARDNVNQQDAWKTMVKETLEAEKKEAADRARQAEQAMLADQRRRENNAIGIGSAAGLLAGVAATVVTGGLAAPLVVAGTTAAATGTAAYNDACSVM
jgi:hypothetical protein